MRYIMLPLVLALSGCFYQTVNNNDIQTAIKVCGSLDNIVEISSHVTGQENVECIDRTTHVLTENAWKTK
jgi:hypothetical protein